MKTAPAVFELLRQSVLGRADPPLVAAAASNYGSRAIVRAACWHGVENHLLLALENLHDEPFPLGPLRSLYARSTALHLRVIADVAALAPLLEHDGIPALVVKGPVLAELYPKPDLRAYSDLDLVVPRGRSADAVGVMTSAGSRLLDRNWKRIRSEARAQVHLLAPNGSSVDLHWHLVNRGIARRGLTIDIDALLERARPTRVSGVPCLTTDPVDTALHVIVHAGVSGGARLSQLSDVRQAVGVSDLDWDALVTRARLWGAGEMVAIMLDRVSRVFDMQPPVDVVGRLRAQRGWSAAVSAIEPRARPELRGENGLVARLTRAARQTRSASAYMAVAWLGFQSRDWVSRRVAGRLGLAGADADDACLEYLAPLERPREGGHE